MFNDAYLAIIRFMEMGGDVLWFIAAITFLMWSLIFERIWFFRTEHKTLVLEASSKWEGRSERKSWSAHQVREGIISDGATRIAGSLPIIETCVALCPLFGLLGTVTGMIAVFDAMATQGGNAFYGRWCLDGNNPNYVWHDCIFVRFGGYHLSETQGRIRD